MAGARRVCGLPLTPIPIRSTVLVLLDLQEKCCYYHPFPLLPHSGAVAVSAIHTFIGAFCFGGVLHFWFGWGLIVPAAQTTTTCAIGRCLAGETRRLTSPRTSRQSRSTTRTPTARSMYGQLRHYFGTFSHGWLSSMRPHTRRVLHAIFSPVHVLSRS